jgi:hypothetical protein
VLVYQSMGCRYCLFQLLFFWILELLGQCSILELPGQCSILELLGQCSILELLGQCSILELLGQCSILELLRQCSIFVSFFSDNVIFRYVDTIASWLHIVLILGLGFSCLTSL